MAKLNTKNRELYVYGKSLVGLASDIKNGENRMFVLSL